MLLACFSPAVVPVSRLPLPPRSRPGPGVRALQRILPVKILDFGAFLVTTGVAPSLCSLVKGLFVRFEAAVSSAFVSSMGQKVTLNLLLCLEASELTQEQIRISILKSRGASNAR